MRHRELRRDLPAFAFPEHVNAARINGVRSFRPPYEFLDRLHVRHAEFLRLRSAREEHIVIANAEPKERLPDREDVRVRWCIVFREAEKEPDLPCRILGSRSGDTF